MKNKSIWTDFKENNHYSKLNNDIKCDVLIIGGGITGLSTLYHLSKSNLKICLVEKNNLGRAVTSKTTGKLTYLQENIYSKLLTYHNIDIAKQYLESQIEAIDIVKNIIKKEKIACDLEKVSSYIFENKNPNLLEKEKKLLKKLEVPFKETSLLPNGYKVSSAYYVQDTYVFHPLKYLDSLAKLCIKNNTSIYENTKIVSIKKENNIYICETPHNKINAKYIVLALHYPYFITPFLMPLKCYIEKSYIEAFEVTKNYHFSAINTSHPTISTRYHSSENQNYQLFLTNSHNLCVKNNENKNFKNLRVQNKFNPLYLWSNMDIMTSDFLPYIGSINKENTLLLATGYNTWGMTNGSLAGKIISDIILKKPNKYITLFDPKRALNLGKIISFPLILSSNAYAFFKSKLIRQKSWYSNNVKFKKINGENVAIYIDENQKEHIVYSNCPHLRCGLIFNEVEKTWDCPCHGSRFDIDGKSIEGPSNYNITYRK